MPIRELMPIFEFDEMQNYREVDGNKLYNYWGYNSVSFFAPNTSYNPVALGEREHRKGLLGPPLEEQQFNGIGPVGVDREIHSSGDSRGPIDLVEPLPLIPMEDLIIYELHVRGFTKDASSGVLHPGTFAGLREKLPYLKRLGVNAVELMPIFEFDEMQNYREVDGNNNAVRGHPIAQAVQDHLMDDRVVAVERVPAL